jgi:uncharacterized protein (UPF0333 family)
MALAIDINARSHLTRFSRRLGEQRGQSLVEFAIVLPVLILIILGIIYFGRYEDYANQETQLAETGARWAAVAWQSGSYAMPSSCTGSSITADKTGLQCYILAQAQPELQHGSSDVTKAQVWVYQPTSAVGGWQDGQPARVCIMSRVTFPSPIGSPALNMAEAGTMRIEGVPVSDTNSSNPYLADNPGGAATPPSNSNCPLT